MDIDLKSLGIDPDAYFVDIDNREYPLVVENATGNPTYTIVDGKVIPYADRVVVKPSGPDGGFKAEGGGFQFGINVAPPETETA